MLFLLTEFGWRELGHFFEVFAEEKLVAVADLSGDFFDGIITFDEPVFGLIDTLSSQPIDGACSDGRFKLAAEVTFTHAGDLRQLGDANGRVVIKAHFFQGLLHGHGQLWLDRL